MRQEIDLDREIATKNIRSMKKWEKINSGEYGKRLFSVFGQGDSRILLFPTPLETVGKEATIFNFLAATPNWFRIIEIEKKEGDGVDAKEIEKFIGDKLGSRTSVLSKRFWNEFPYAFNKINGVEQIILGKYRIHPDKTESDSMNKKNEISHYLNCKLKEADDQKIQQIFDINIARAEKEFSSVPALQFNNQNN
jgi:hypothetical protein